MQLGSNIVFSASGEPISPDQFFSDFINERAKSFKQEIPIHNPIAEREDPNVIDTIAIELKEEKNPTPIKNEKVEDSNSSENNATTIGENSLEEKVEDSKEFDKLQFNKLKLMSDQYNIDQNVLLNLFAAVDAELSKVNVMGYTLSDEARAELVYDALDKISNRIRREKDSMRVSIKCGVRKSLRHNMREIKKVVAKGENI